MPAIPHLTDAVDGLLNGKRYLIHDRDPLYAAEFLSLLAEARSHWERTKWSASRLRPAFSFHLSREQAHDLLAQPDSDTVEGKRDHAILAVLLGCALRRSELAALACEHIQQRDGRWAFVDLVGEGKRIRTVPIPPFVKVAIDAWTATGLYRRAKCQRAWSSARHSMRPGRLFDWSLSLSRLSSTPSFLSLA